MCKCYVLFPFRVEVVNLFCNENDYFSRVLLLSYLSFPQMLVSFTYMYVVSRNV
jgi:hypothetical protein